MKPLFVVAVTWLISIGLGRTLLNLLFRRKPDQPQLLNPAEQIVFASGIGLGVVAYGVFALGLTGHLSVIEIGLWLLVAGLVGIPGWLATWAECREIARRRSVQPAVRRENDKLRAAEWSLAGILVVLAIFAACACYQPPGPHAWDALAYHLAAPKVYLSHHLISVLPTQHHSNFPFTMEMLFTIGLAFEGYTAANLFHLLTCVLLVLAILCFCDRFLTRLAGLIASVIFVTTPLVLWEATVAYIDLALSLYLFLAAYLIILVNHLKPSQPIQEDRATTALSFEAMCAAGVLMGFALGMKYLAIVPLVFLIALALARKLPPKFIIAFALTAGIVGSPWYIKNVLWMRNPVYPFAFNVFKDSRYWSADRAAPYADEQRSFGMEHALTRPLDSLRNLAIAPWKLLSNPELYTNKADFTFTSLAGGIYAGFMFSLAFVRGKPKAIHDVAAIGISMFAAWFFVSQHVRYLIPLLPFGALLSGYAATRWLQIPSAAIDVSLSNSRNKLVNAFSFFLVGSAIVGQIVVLGWGIFALPVGGREAVRVQEAGLEPTALSMPEIFAEFGVSGERDRHLHRLNSYDAVEWINHNTTVGAGVVLFDDVHGFYLDRPYLWGNEGHSSYIPYSSFSTSHAMTEWFLAHGIHYALFNLKYEPFFATVTPISDDPDSVQALLGQSYAGNGSGWRGKVQEAMQNGEWRVRYCHHDAAVVEIGVSGG